jgi:hypothetical protein
MPRLPFKIGARKTESATVATDTKPLPYDSTRAYMQMGSVLQASELAQLSLLRLSQTISETLEAKELQETALLERLGNILAEMDAFERLFVKFELRESQKTTQLLSASFECVRTSLGWFQKFLANHGAEESDSYRPLANRLQAVVRELADVRNQKASDTVAMEEAFTLKKKSVQKQANATRPVKRNNLPYPAEPTLSVTLPVEEVLQGAREEILKKELANKKLGD